MPAIPKSAMRTRRQDKARKQRQDAKARRACTDAVWARAGGHCEREIHAAIHAGKMRVEGNADECITVWRRTGEGWHQVVRETPTGIERD